MDKSELFEILIIADGNVAYGKRILERQRARIDKLKVAGENTALDQRVLTELVRQHDVNVADRNRMLRLVCNGALGG